MNHKKIIAVLLLFLVMSVFGAAPSWFVNMKVNTWATPVTNTLNDVQPSDYPGGHVGFRAVCDAWTGGTVDQDRGEFTLAANGGHADYGGNEVYACALRKESPVWERLTEPTRSGGGSDLMNSCGCYEDGTMRSVHGWNRCCWGNGRVWYAGCDGMWVSGLWSTACHSFNRSTLKWTYHGKPGLNTSGSFNWQGGPGNYDRVGNRVWSLAGYATQDGGYSVDASTGNMTKYNWYVAGGNSQSWGVIIYDGNPRVWIIGRENSHDLRILNLENVAAGWTTKGTSGSPKGFGSGVGAVYHQATRSVYCWNGYGANIRKMSVPSNTLTGTYTWSQVSPASGNTVTPSGQAQWGTYGKFNIIEDMGNGQSALCLVNSVTGPVYVFKLPAGTTKIDNPGRIEDAFQITVSPNPIRTGTNVAISFWPLAISQINISIFNINGELITKLTANSQQLKAGIPFNTSGLSTGIYILKTQIGNKVFSKRLLLQK